MSSMETAPPFVPAFEMHDRARVLRRLGLSANEFFAFFQLASQMQAGNRVTISVTDLASAIKVSRPTARRALQVLRQTRLLLDPDAGLPVVNPLYVAHNIAEADFLIGRFGIDALPVDRAAARAVPVHEGRHLSVVR
jgi:predicted transcriptional regulator